MKPEKSEIIIYQTEDGITKIDVRMEDETVWLTQAQIAELFGRDISVISRHIKNIFSEGEIDSKSNLQNLQIPNSDKPVAFYSLEVIIAVGYRVKSVRGTQFRQWAIAILQEYLQKGFSMNDELLKAAGGGNYWRELLDRIRDIRSSEKALYRQVLDLYATSMDYNAKAEETLMFFKVVQNKLHFTVSGQMASEIVFNRANAELPFMGLTNFSGQALRKSEIGVAKNYMTEDELFALNRLVSAFFGGSIHPESVLLICLEIIICDIVIQKTGVPAVLLGDLLMDELLRLLGVFAKMREAVIHIVQGEVRLVKKTVFYLNHDLPKKRKWQEYFMM